MLFSAPRRLFATLATNCAAQAPRGAAALASAHVESAGRHVCVAWEDGLRVAFHSAWLRDSSPAICTRSFRREHPGDFARSLDALAIDASVASDYDLQGGDALRVNLLVPASGELLPASHTDGSAAAASEEAHAFPSDWLRAMGPLVGDVRAEAGAEDSISCTRATYTTLDELTRTSAARWAAEHVPAAFSASALIAPGAAGADEQLRLLETVATEGIAIVHGVGTAADLADDSAVGAPLEALVRATIGRMVEHPRRRTRTGVLRSSAAVAVSNTDYDLSNPLGFHTDHSFYAGVPGYMQWLLQARGTVRSSVVNGLTAAEALRDTMPDAFRLLTKTPIVHNVRTMHYTLEGAPCNLDHDHEGAYEALQTHPIIELRPDGSVNRIMHSESKRAVMAELPFGEYHDYMRAYAAWCKLLHAPGLAAPFELPEGSAVVYNNHTTLHTRASAPLDGGERVAAWGYVSKPTAEMRARMLRMRALEAGFVDAKWTTRLPPRGIAALEVALAQSQSRRSK